MTTALQEFYGFKTQPFNITTDAELFFEGSSHQEALGFASQSHGQGPPGPFVGEGRGLPIFPGASQGVAQIGMELVIVLGKAAFGFQTLASGLWLPDFGFHTLASGLWLPDFGFRQLSSGLWLPDFGFRTLSS